MIVRLLLVIAMAIIMPNNLKAAEASKVYTKQGIFKLARKACNEKIYTEEGYRDQFRTLLQNPANRKVAERERRNGVPLMHVLTDTRMIRALFGEAPIAEDKKDSRGRVKRAADTERVYKEKVERCTQLFYATDNTGKTALHNAVAAAHPAHMRTLFFIASVYHIELDLNIKDADGRSPLHYVKSELVARELLERPGLEVNAFDKKGMTPLHFLLARGVKYNDAAAVLIKGRLARREEYSDVVQHRINRFVTYELPLLKGNNTKISERVEQIIPRIAANLEVIVGTGTKWHDKQLTRLHAKGFDKVLAKNCGLRPLHIAVRTRNREMIRELLESGANHNTRDYNGNTPLHLAAAIGDMRVLNIVVQPYADSIDDYANFSGETVLHIAGKGDHVEVMRFFIESGANINIPDLAGRSVLHVAVGNINMLSFKVCIDDVGVDLLVEDGRGRTPLMLAEKMLRIKSLNHGKRMSLESIAGQLRRRMELDQETESRKTGSPVSFASSVSFRSGVGGDDLDLEQNGKLFQEEDAAAFSRPPLVVE